jgi:hypothetical protein
MILSFGLAELWGYVASPRGRKYHKKKRRQKIAEEDLVLCRKKMKMKTQPRDKSVIEIHSTYLAN